LSSASPFSISARASIVCSISPSVSIFASPGLLAASAVRSV
jgi:hypothetical protein